MKLTMGSVDEALLPGTVNVLSTLTRPQNWLRGNEPALALAFAEEQIDAVDQLCAGERFCDVVIGA